MLIKPTVTANIKASLADHDPISFISRLTLWISQPQKFLTINHSPLGQAHTLDFANSKQSIELSRPPRSVLNL